MSGDAHRQHELETARQRIAALEADLAAAQQREQALRAVITHHPNATAVFDADMRYIAVSNAYMDTFGIQDQAIIGQSHYDLFPEITAEGRAIHRRALAGAIESGERSKFERRDGSIDWVNWESRPWHDATGAVGGIITYTEVINAQVETETALHASEQQYQHIADSFPGVLYQFSARATGWQMDYISSRVEAVFGVSAAEIMADLQAFTQHVHPDDLARLDDSIEKAIDSRQPWSFESRFIRPDGREIWWQGASQPVLQPDGQVTHNGVLLDITDRKQADQAEEKRSAALRNLFDALPQNIYMKDRAGRLIFANKRFQELAGQPIDTLIGQTTNDLRDPKLAAKYLADDQRVLDTGEIFTGIELHQVIDTGEELLVQVIKAPTRDSQGNITGTVGVFWDVTAEQKAREALERQRREQQIILDHAPGMIFFKDKNNLIIRVNQAVAAAVGRPVDELVGVSGAELFPDHAEQYYWDDLQVINSNQPRLGIVEPITLAGGEQRWLRTDKIPYRDDNGAVIGVMAYSQDITDLKHAEAEVERQRAFLRQVIDTSPNMIFAKDKHLRLTLANQALADMHGTSVEALLGQLSGAYNRDSAEAKMFQADDLKVIDSGQPIFIPEESVTGADGITRWFQTTKVPLRDEQGNVIQVLGVATDITERKQAQQELERQRAFLRQIIDQSPGLIFAKDDQGRFTLANAGLATIVGSPVENLVGKTDSDFNSKPEEVAQYLDADRRVIETGQTLFIPEEPVTGADGITRWYQTTKVPLRDETGKPNQVLALATDITERKQAEQELERQRTFLRTIIDQIPSLIFTKDMDGRFILTNQPFASRYGLEPHEIIGKTESELHPNPDEVEEFTRMDRRVIDSGQPYFTSEAPLTADDGATRWYQGATIPLFDDNGNVFQILGVATDITERKRAEQELEQQQKFLRTVIDENPSLIFAKDRDGRFTLANKLLADRYKLKPEDLIGKTDAEIHPSAEESAAFESADQQVFETGQPMQTHEVPATDEDGVVHWYQGARVPLFDATGQVEQVLGVATDITDRKTTEQALEDERNLLRTLIDTIPEAIFVKDRDSRYVNINATLARRLGVGDPADALGKSDADFWDEDIAQHFIDKDRQVMETGKAIMNAEEDLRGTDSAIAWVSTSKVPLRDRDGNITGLVGIAIDVTDRKAVEQEREKLLHSEQAARREAQEAVRMKDLFLATMSHELRTPLNAIIGYQHLMIYSETMDEDNVHMAERTLTNSQRLLNLINDILDISRIASGGLEIVPVDMSLRVLATGVHENMQMQAREKSLTLTFEVADNLPPLIHHDEERIHQIVTNLVSNAIKFTDEGTVHAHYYEQSSKLMIEVTDSGVGIPAARQHTIFDDFVQVDNSSTRKYGGAGLGLAIVRRLTLLMGGRIRVQSEVGKGSAFTVELPLNLIAETTSQFKKQNGETS